MIFISEKGMGLNAEKTDNPEQGRVSGGGKGMMLDADNVVFAAQVSAGQPLVLVTDKAYAKQINVSELDVLARYRKGVKVFDLKGASSSGTKIICAGTFKEDDDIECEDGTVSANEVLDMLKKL